MLTTSQLNGLLDQWGRAKAPVAGALRPGLPAAEVASRLEQTLGLPAPRDLVTLWSWRNGSEPGRLDAVVGPHLFLLSLDGAIEQYHSMRRLAEESSRRMQDWGPDLGRPDYWWRPTWVPLLRADDGGIIATDAATALPDTPIWSVRWADYDPDGGPLLPSVAALVELLQDNIRRGLWSYDDEQGWLRDPNAPHDRRLSPAGLA